jgi:hypothetical protein
MATLHGGEGNLWILSLLLHEELVASRINLQKKKIHIYKRSRIFTQQFLIQFLDLIMTLNIHGLHALYPVHCESMRTRLITEGYFRDKRMSIIKSAPVLSH